MYKMNFTSKMHSEREKVHEGAKIKLRYRSSAPDFILQY